MDPVDHDRMVLCTDDGYRSHDALALELWQIQNKGNIIYSTLLSLSGETSRISEPLVEPQHQPTVRLIRRCDVIFFFIGQLRGSLFSLPRHFNKKWLGAAKRVSVALLHSLPALPSYDRHGYGNKDFVLYLFSSMSLC
jgi:hypothetical protein